MAEWLKHSHVDVSLVYYPIVKKRGNVHDGLLSKGKRYIAAGRATSYQRNHCVLTAKQLVAMDVQALKKRLKTYHTEAKPTILMTPAAKVGLFVFAHGDLTISLKFRIFQCSLGVLSTRRSAIYVFDNQRTCHTSGLLDPS